MADASGYALPSAEVFSYGAIVPDAAFAPSEPILVALDRDMLRRALHCGLSAAAQACGLPALADYGALPAGQAGFLDAVAVGTMEALRGGIAP